MPAGSKIKGRDGIISLNDGSSTEEIPCLTGWTLDTSASLTEDTTACMLSNGDGGTVAGADWSTSEVESKSWNLNAEFTWQKDDTVGTTGFADATNVGDTVACVLYPNLKDGIGNRTYSGNGIIESVSITSETASIITVSMAIKGDGALTKQVTGG